MYRFSSPAMADVERLAGKVAPTDSTVLITGESGTGKELVARAIHRASSSARGAPFVAVNCGAIPEQPARERALRPRARAPSPAPTARAAACFVEADGGTLFLDEIGELPLDMQAKLLRVLQEREVRAGRQRPAAAASTCASSPPPTATSPQMVNAGQRSARTCTTA